MPFIDAIELFDYWAEYPPLHLLVRNFLGYKPPRKEVDAVEMGQVMRAVSPRSKGRSKSLDNAPLHIQHMAEEARKLKKEKPNG